VNFYVKSKYMTRCPDVSGFIVRILPEILSE
jgi:hypothetical protein